MAPVASTSAKATRLEKQVAEQEDGSDAPLAGGAEHQHDLELS